MSRAQNGIVTYVDIMTRALRAAGHECVVITPNLLERDDDNAVYELDTAEGNFARAMWKRLRRRVIGGDRDDVKDAAIAISRALAQASKDGPIDVVEIEESFGFALFLRQYAPSPVVIRLHGPHFLVHQGARAEQDHKRIKAEGDAITTADAVSCPTRRVLEDVRAYYGAAGAVNAVIPNPVAVPPEGQCWRLEACDRNMLLFVGRFDLIKGADVMLDAFARLAERHKDLRLVIAGPDKGVPGKDGAVVKFDAFARARLPDAVRGRVSFLGSVDPVRLADLRRQAFACVSASRFEVFPYAVTEALATGCPVVSTATPGLLELLTDSENVLLADIENAEEMAARIEELIADPERARRLGMAGRKTVATRISPETIAVRAADFYKRVIGEAGENV